MLQKVKLRAEVLANEHNQGHNSHPWQHRTAIILPVQACVPETLEAPAGGQSGRVPHGHSGQLAGGGWFYPDGRDFLIYSGRLKNTTPTRQQRYD